MLKKDRYWVLKDSEMDIIVNLLRSHQAFESLSQGSMVNAILTEMQKAVDAKQAAEQQPIADQDEPEETTYQQEAARPQPQPPRRGVAARVSQTAPLPPAPVPPGLKKKPILRKPEPAQVEEQSEEYSAEEEDSDVEDEDLLADFKDDDF